MKGTSISDIHAHLYKEFAVGDSRLKDIVRVLRGWGEYAQEHGIRYGVINGDIFHNRKIIDVGVWNATWDVITWLADEVFLELDINVGNHDQADKAGTVHSLLAFNDLPGVKVASEPMETVWADKQHVVIVPYREEKGAILKAVKKMAHADSIVFVHHGITGAVTGPGDFVMKDEIQVEDFPDVKFVLCGHYHKHQWCGDNVLMIGSPLQLNRGERNDGPKGWVVFDTDAPMGRGSGNPELVEWTKAPKFIEVAAKDLADPVVKASLQGHFVTVMAETDEDARAAHAQLDGEAQGLSVRKVKADLDMKAAAVNLDMEDAEVVRAYCEAKNAAGMAEAGLAYLQGRGLVE